MIRSCFLFILLLSASLVKAADTTVVKEPVKASLKVYPNPASSYVIVTYELAAPAPVMVQITNFNGGLVKTTGVNASAGQQRLNISLNGLTSGTYIVRILVDGTIETKKLVVY